MPDDNEDNQNMAPKKQKTTYNQQHPTDNPKPPKRSRAEIQAAAAEKRAATIAKNNELAGIQAATELKKQQKKKKGLKEVAAMEDAVQRQQKQCQLQAERPNLQTMQTYQTINESHTLPKAKLNDINTSSAPAGGNEQEEGELSNVKIPPHSTFDTDSDGGLLGMENFDYQGESEDDSDIYVLEDKDEEEEAFSDSESSIKQPENTDKASGKKERGLGKREDIQAAAEDDASDKQEEDSSGLNNSANAANTGNCESKHHDARSQQSPRWNKNVRDKLQKVNSKNTVDSKPRWQLAKPHYNNSHFPFENVNHDLQTWHESVIPAIIDWSGTLEDGFGVNAHPDLSEIVQDNWNNKFPSIDCDDAVLSVASSAIQNWCSSIKIFAVHHQLVAKTDKFYGFPAGALSLCAAANVPLNFGVPVTPPKKDTKTSFVHRPWATRAAAHFQTIKKLSESKWRVIVKAAGLVMDSCDEDFDPTGENNSELGDPDGVVILEDEAATTD
ncbi:hypothetical protein BYT27DRAFT_7253262 [Phlegmacium glaucopus]|nr:hypothetical protein BYT27DRAFT_7253262 [Phlegmacium glaucopus]